VVCGFSCIASCSCMYTQERIYCYCTSYGVHLLDSSFKNLSSKSAHVCRPNQDCVRWAPRESARAPETPSSKMTNSTNHATATVREIGVIHSSRCCSSVTTSVCPLARATSSGVCPPTRLRARASPPCSRSNLTEA